MKQPPVVDIKIGKYGPWLPDLDVVFVKYLFEQS